MGMAIVLMLLLFILFMFKRRLFRLVRTNPSYETTSITHLPGLYCRCRDSYLHRERDHISLHKSLIRFVAGETGESPGLYKTKETRLLKEKIKGVPASGTST